LKNTFALKPMSPDEQAAFDQIQLAEVELALIKQELVLQHLVDIREPTEEARVMLLRLREAVARLSEARMPRGAQSSEKAA
jgi:hypothetical protein